MNVDIRSSRVSGGYSYGEIVSVLVGDMMTTRQQLLCFSLPKKKLKNARTQTLKHLEFYVKSIVEMASVPVIMRR